MSKTKIAITTTLALLIAITGSYLYADKETQSLTQSYRESKGGTYAKLPLGTVHYELRGESQLPTVVLVHGFSVPDYVWDPTFEHLLEQGFRVLRFDLYGRGLSDRPDLPYDMDTYVTQLKDLLDHLNLKQAIHLVGLSMGGAVVTHFSHRYPERVLKVSLLAPLVATPSKPEMAPLMLPGLGEYMAKVIMLPRMLNGVDKAVYDPASFNDWREQFEPQTKIEGFSHAILSTARYLNGKDFSEQYRALGKSGKAVQLFWGRNDLTLPFANHQLVIDAIPDIEFFALDQTGHLPNVERVDFVNSKLVAFLAKEAVK